MIAELDSSHPPIDAYIDGVLARSDRDAFERLLGSDADLRSEVDLAFNIDASLRRLFAHGVEPTTSKTTSRMSLRWVIAIAASLAIVLGGWQVWSFFSPRPSMYDAGAWRSVAQVYHDTVAGGFQPRWVCRDDKEFAETFEGRFGEAVVVHPSTERITAVGIDYAHSISPSTITVLFRVEDSPVLVLVDRAERDQQIGIEGEPELFVHRGRVGRLVLYEVSPLPEAHVIDAFSIPDFQ